MNLSDRTRFPVTDGCADCQSTLSGYRASLTRGARFIAVGGALCLVGIALSLVSPLLLAACAGGGVVAMLHGWALRSRRLAHIRNALGEVHTHAQRGNLDVPALVEVDHVSGMGTVVQPRLVRKTVVIDGIDAEGVHYHTVHHPETLRLPMEDFLFEVAKKGKSGSRAHLQSLQRPA